MESVKETVKIRVCKGGAWERVDGALEYMPLNCVKRTLILPLLSSYSCLLEAVSERLEIDANSDFMVTYNSDNDIVEVCDDLEVNEFMEFVVKSSRIVTLCIVESSVNGRQSSNSGSNQQSNFIHATPSVNVYQTEYHATQIPVFPGSGGFYQNVPSYQQMHGFSGNPMYVPGFPGYPMQDPQSDSANRKLKQVVGSPKNKKPNERDLLDDEKLRPFGEKIMGSVFGKVKRLSGEDESSESDEDAETTPVANKNFKEDKFWNMPPLLKTPVLDMKKKGMCSGTSSLVRLHETFDSKEQIKIVLGRKALEEGFQIRYPRSDPHMVYAKCVVDTCGWLFRAYIPKDYKKFYVTAFVDHHTCTKTQIHPHHRNASPKVLGHILKEVMSESSRIYRGKEIMTDMNARFKIDISYSQAWRAKCYALQLLRGTPRESFSELPLYCHNLKLKNQGTITHIETDDEDRFEIFFLAIGAVIRTFVLHMRPLIIIDGAHLKGEFLGTMYLAVAMDDHLTIISDGVVSIASAIKNVFPNAFHGRCCRHLLMNLREKCPRFISKEELFWKACKAYRISDFEERFSTLRDWLPSIANKLDMIGLEKWARVHFPGMRYNYMTSNSAESVNALSRHSRKLPICMMIDWFIKSLQQWYFEHRQTADEHKHELTPWAEAKLAQRIAKSATWTVRPAANYLYNVVDYYKNATVDLNTRTCSCGQWQLSGLPCGHLIAVMRHLRQSSANQFAFSCFKTSVWRASYNEVIYDVGHPSEWDKPDGLIIVLPPVMDKRLPGRPRNRDRFRSKGEQITQKSCTRCFKGGHNRRDCPSVVPSQIFIPTTSSVKSCSSWNVEI
ncbi:transmembrane 9 superfamily member 11-like protein [Tanacetum coccineum]|uniref:Transmembrane 9 superfamily member 11-like protein n=1 Tax=Tanacetum coccineum TaxID=301880 RepID=A0ABQ5HS83_9ASTR